MSTMVKELSLRDFYKKSRAFWGRHPRPISSSTTLEGLVESKHISEADAQKYIQSTRIIVHQTARQIATAFLADRKVHGTATEKHVYAQIDWDLDRFLARLIRQRPLSFYGAGDTTLLRNNKHFRGATKKWDRVGSDNEDGDIHMTEYLTYDEMMVSSLIGVSGYTPYLNDGNRYNRGVVDATTDAATSKTQFEGVQVGLVGARFKRRGKMDSLHVRGDEDELGVASSVFATYFAGDSFEARYKARMRITIESLLLEAAYRGQEASQQVYVHVVGLGLGVWAIHPDQPRWYIETFAQALIDLSARSDPTGDTSTASHGKAKTKEPPPPPPPPPQRLSLLTWIAVLEFAYIDVDPETQQQIISAATSAGTHQHQTKSSTNTNQTSGGIKCLFNRRSPSTKLPPPSSSSSSTSSSDPPLLLVTSYAWDGNSYPGNEFYLGKLTSSGDPAAACSTLISETHNPEINVEFLHHIKDL